MIAEDIDDYHCDHDEHGVHWETCGRTWGEYIKNAYEDNTAKVTLFDSRFDLHFFNSTEGPPLASHDSVWQFASHRPHVPLGEYREKVSRASLATYAAHPPKGPRPEVARA